VNLRDDWEDAGWMQRLLMVVAYVVGVPLVLLGLAMGWCWGAFRHGFRRGLDEADEA